MALNRQLSILALGICLVVGAATITVAIEAPRPKIPPGYVPEEAETEKGLWLQLSEYEVAIQQSALLVKDENINDYVRKAACVDRKSVV